MFAQALVLALSIVCAPPYLGDGFKEAPCSTGPLYWKGLTAEEVDWASKEMPRALSQVIGRLGRTETPPFTTVLVSNRYEMRRVLEGIVGSSAPAQPVLGVTIPSLALVVIRWDHLPPRESLSETFAHEAAHIVLHPSNCSALPRWLDEGLAQWASGRRLSPDELAYLSFLARVEGLYPLSSLRSQFPSVHEFSTIAYEESLLFVLYLVEAHGAARLPELLEACRGQPVEQVLERISGHSVEEVERQFHAWVVGQAAWGSALASVINLWTLSGVLALAAIVRHALRRRQKLRAMADEEAPGSEVGAKEAEEAEDPEVSGAPPG